MFLTPGDKVTLKPKGISCQQRPDKGRLSAKTPGRSAGREKGVIIALSYIRQRLAGQG
jgi:hypothetical protein